jgi:hypothetical protein
MGMIPKMNSTFGSDVLADDRQTALAQRIILNVTMIVAVRIAPLTA